jgi:hypothetical protein
MRFGESPGRIRQPGVIAPAPHCYVTEHGRNQTIARAFAQGCGGKIVPPAPLRPGAVFMYGALRGLMPTLLQAQAEGRTWYYADNGYFRRAFKDPERGYFRVTRNARHHDGSGNAGAERWSRLGLEIRPWRQTGEHVLLCPPNATHCALWAVDAEAWLASTVARLKAATDRPIVTRIRKDQIAEPGGFAKALKRAWAVVTHSTNGAVEAVLAGVPMFCTDFCAAYRMGTPDLERIEDPVMPSDAERQQWAWNLAANQWTVAEMRDGVCWQELDRATR